MNVKRFLKIIGIEILILIVLNAIINKILYDTRMAAGSWGIFAPLPIFEKIYSMSQVIRSNFNLAYLLVDLVIIIGIGLLFTFLKFKKTNSITKPNP